MNIEIVNNVSIALGIGTIDSVSKLEVGFTNEVYSLDNKYILKVCRDASNEIPFKREAILCNYFRDQLPVPQDVIFDDSKALYPKNFMIYPKIAGENLYNVWHTFTNEQRKELVKQLCGLLKTISATELNKLPKELELEPLSSWREHVTTKIDKYLKIVEKAGTLSNTETNKIREYIQQHSTSLNEQKIALVYWDAHFDNILAKDNKIVGLLDFERTELASMDFMLDVVKRMVEQPKKYMSEYAEQFAKDEDYARLLDWYREFYPELFEFDELDTRLDLYEIAHNLEDLENWPQVSDLKNRILKIVG